MLFTFEEAHTSAKKGLYYYQTGQSRSASEATHSVLLELGTKIWEQYSQHYPVKMYIENQGIGCRLKTHDKPTTYSENWYIDWHGNMHIMRTLTEAEPVMFDREKLKTELAQTFAIDVLKNIRWSLAVKTSCLLDVNNQVRLPDTLQTLVEPHWGLSDIATSMAFKGMNVPADALTSALAQ